MTAHKKRILLRQILNLKMDLELSQLVKLTGYNWKELTETRLRNRVVWRQILMAYLYSKGETLEKIGGLFKKDHATVIHAIRTFINLYNWKDSLTLECVNKLKSRHEIEVVVSNVAEKLMSKHYTNWTSELLDFETKVEYSWVLDAINEALLTKNVQL